MLSLFVCREMTCSTFSSGVAYFFLTRRYPPPLTASGRWAQRQQTFPVPWESPLVVPIIGLFFPTSCTP